MNIAYKIVMIIVGCFVAYYIMSLATESKKLVKGMAEQSVDGRSINKVSGKIRAIEEGLGSLENEVKSSVKTLTRDLERFKSQEDEQENKLKDSFEKIAEDEEQQENIIKTNIDRIKDVEEKHSQAIQAISEKFEAVSKTTSLGNDTFITVSDFDAEKKSDDNREAAIEKKLAEQSAIIEKLVADNAAIKAQLVEKTTEIKELKATSSISQELLKTFEKSGNEEFAIELKDILGGMSGAGKQVCEGLQRQLDALEDAFKDSKELSSKTLEGIERALKDSKALSAKTLEGVEKNMDSLEKRTTQVMDDTKQWMLSEIKGLSGKNNVDSSSVVNIDIESTVQKVTNKFAIEIEVLKKEFEGLQKKINDLASRDTVEKSSEPVGIIVNTTFEKSIVMLNTAEGTFVFNPYADFTGVVRVRDADGNEKMVLVPYTGEYLKIGNNIIDTGPFSKSCAQGINCNIDVRGSFNAPVVK